MCEFLFLYLPYLALCCVVSNSNLVKDFTTSICEKTVAISKLALLFVVGLSLIVLRIQLKNTKIDNRLDTRIGQKKKKEKEKKKKKDRLRYIYISLEDYCQYLPAFLFEAQLNHHSSLTVRILTSIC